MNSYYIEWGPFLFFVTLLMLAMASVFGHVDLIEPSLWTYNAELLWEKYKEPELPDYPEKSPEESKEESTCEWWDGETEFFASLSSDKTFLMKVSKRF